MLAKIWPQYYDPRLSFPIPTFISKRKLHANDRLLKACGGAQRSSTHPPPLPPPPPPLAGKRDWRNTLGRRRSGYEIKNSREKFGQSTSDFT